MGLLTLKKLGALIFSPFFRSTEIDGKSSNVLKDSFSK